MPALSDSLRQALDEVFARPEYSWAAYRSPFDWLRELWYRLLDWLGAMQTVHPVGFKALLVVLIAVLAGLLAHIGYVVWRIMRPTAGVPVVGAAAGGGLRLEDARAHRERAHELAGAGRYAEALAHQFAALLLDLERRRAVTFHPSKTPAEYVSEARLDPTGRASLADLVSRLYRHLFGAAPCDEHAYRDFAAAAELVPRHVAPG
ncbi:MAG: DUF4129 domain-containing protein [Gemmatimonadales bacterium]